MKLVIDILKEDLSDSEISAILGELSVAIADNGLSEQMDGSYTFETRYHGIVFLSREED